MIKLSDFVPKFITVAGLVWFAKPTITVEEFPVPRVVNGTPAGLGDFPYQVALKRAVRNTEMHVTYCGAAIIAPQKILSAAHCLVRTKNKTLSAVNLQAVYAVAGILDTRGKYQDDSQGTEQWRRIQLIIVPKNYRFPKSDIGLAFTKEPFVYNDYVAQVSYATKDEEYGRRTCIVSGYGITLEGDSGSPLVCRPTAEGPQDRVVGVVSGSKKGAGSFFIRVSSFKDFIAQESRIVDIPNAVMLTTPGYVCVFLVCIRTLTVSFLFY